MDDDPQRRGSTAEHSLNVPAAVLLISGTSLPADAAAIDRPERLVLTEPARRAEACYLRLQDHADRDWAASAEATFREVVGTVGRRLADRAGERPDLMSELASLISGQQVRFPGIAAASMAVAAGIPTWTVRVPLSPGDPAANPWYAMDPRGRDCFLGLVGKALAQAAMVAEVLSHGLATATFEPRDLRRTPPVPFDPAYRDHQRWAAEVERVVAEIGRIGAERDRALDRWTAGVADRLDRRAA